ncbi:MAG: hypothetical protein ACYC7A_17415 [Thermoanaerobaculia bacterium]
MNARTLAQVFLRLWGIALLVWGAAGIGNLFLFFVPAEQASDVAAFRMSAAATAISIFVYLFVGLALIRNGDRIGEWLVSDLSSEASVSPASALEIQAVALAILGAYFLVDGVRDLAAILGAIVVKPSWDETKTTSLIWDRYRDSLISGAVTTVAGVILLARGQNLAAVLSKAWSTIRSREASNESQM